VLGLGHLGDILVEVPRRSQLWSEVRAGHRALLVVRGDQLLKSSLNLKRILGHRHGQCWSPVCVVG
jgi:hypothetical protein